MFLGCEGDRALFIISSYSAVKISHISSFPNEAEAVLPFGIRLIVTQSSHSPDDGLTTVMMKEQSCEGLDMAKQLLLLSQTPSPSLLADLFQGLVIDGVTPSSSSSSSRSLSQVSYSPSLPFPLQIMFTCCNTPSMARWLRLS